MTKVPIINIQGQTTYNGDYLSDMTFTIKDKYQYYGYHLDTIKMSKCKDIFIKFKKLKTTTFLEFHIPLQNVVKGKGCTLREKLLHYYNHHQHLIGPSFNDFYIQIILYGMSKYILSKLLYGDFNINYLCQNRNKQFFKDLKHSRFCGFINFFKDPSNNIVGDDQFFITC
jgi:hypothetical protein